MPHGFVNSFVTLSGRLRTFERTKSFSSHPVSVCSVSLVEALSFFFFFCTPAVGELAED